MDNDSKKIYRYGDNITWSLPLFFQYEPTWGAIYKCCKDYGVPTPKINAYGSPANSWTGGRVPIIFDKLDKNTLRKIVQYLIDCEAVPTFVFSYSRIKKEDLADKYANYLLDMGLEVGAHFIVNSDMLKNYIKEKDSNAYVVASVTKSAMRFQGPTKIEEATIENETNYYNKLLKEYDLVVVRPEYSLNAMQENSHLLDDISRIEVLINSFCIKNCPLMPEHYRKVEDARENPSLYKIENFKCYKFHFDDNKYQQEHHAIHTREQVQRLVDSGVKNIKLQGRGMHCALEACALYLFQHIYNELGFNDAIAMDFIQHSVKDEIDLFRKTVLCNNF